MVLVLIVRRIKTLLGFKKKSKRRDRLHSLQDCLNKPKQKSSSWKLLLLASSSSGVVYLLLFLFDRPASDPGILTVTRRDDNDMFTEKMSIVDLIAYEKDQITLIRQTESPEKVKNKTILSFEDSVESLDLPFCITRIVPRKLTVHTIKNETQMKALSMISMGGSYKPRDCRPLQKVGIIVPYREREHNLAIFLYNIHPFLIRQKLHYRIFVIEQNGTELFNRGRLLNAGFLELKKMGEWSCVIVHDVDLLPTNEGVVYSCADVPRHMCADLVRKPSPNYHSYFGGVASMTPTQFRKVNGYSNIYWGWGGEDNDMFWRIKASGIGVVRDSKKTSTYFTLPHNMTQKKNPNRFRILMTSMKRYKEDGLSDIHYNVISYQLRHLYTQILVDINPRRDNHISDN